MSWFETDLKQWVREIDQNRYWVVTSEWIGTHNGYVLKDKIVDISKLSKEKIEDLIFGCYNSLEDMKQIEYNWRQMLATVCVVCQDEEWLLFSEHEEIIAQHLKKKYGLITRFKDFKRTPIFENIYTIYEKEISNGTLSEKQLQKEGMKEEVRKACMIYLQWESSGSYCRADRYEAEEVLVEHGYLEEKKRKK